LNFKFYSFLLIIFSTVLIPTVFADEQVPAAVIFVEGDPFYFSEGDFGIKILKFFERPLTPYLVTGETTEQSSISEISQAYSIATQDLSQQVVVSDNDRAQAIRVTFFGAEIEQAKTFTSFLKFEHLEQQKTDDSRVPYYYDNVQKGFALDSLPSKDKEWFYDNIVSRTINTGLDPFPYDVDIDILTGNGDVLQTWEYRECDLIEYYPILDENLGKLKFIGEFLSEIREVSLFSCEGFHVDFELKPTPKNPENLVKLINFVPENEDRATKFLVQFLGGDLEVEETFFTFSKFGPVKQFSNLPILVPGYSIDKTPQFTLESLPSKDKEKFYEFLNRYISPTKAPEPFDVKVHLVTADNSVLQSWYYNKCDATNYTIFFVNNLLLYKFKQTFGSEIRDKSYYQCKGLDFHVSDSIAPPTEILEQISIPNNDERAQIFVATFQGPDIVPEKIVTSFTRFSPLTNEELRILLPNAPFGEKPKFYFESIPNTDNQWFYELIGRYVNLGSVPEPFEVRVDILSGDKTTLQTWSYDKCHIIDYKSFLDDSLITRKFSKQFVSEIHDRAIFECNGFSLDGTQKSSDVPPQKTLDYVDFVPSEDNRANRFVLTVSGGEITTPKTYYTFAKFEPLIEEQINVPVFHQINSVGFSLESLPSKDKEEFYHLMSRYVNLGKDPEPFDAKIDLVTGNGNIVQSWQYTTCQAIDFDNYLQDNLLFFTMNGQKGISEIREKSVFDCNGFSVNFGSQPNVLQELPDITPSYEERGILYLLTASDGDFTTPKTTAMVSKFSSKDSFRDELDQVLTYSSLRGAITNQGTISSNTQTFSGAQFYGESLPNKFASGGYEFVERYINPGKTPELFDVRVDVVTGDGTILYSGDYSKCEGQTYATYLNDNVVWIKFHPAMKYEFRDRFEIDCAGVDVLVMPQRNPIFSLSESLKKITPVLQQKLGVSPDETVCKDNFTLMTRPPLNSAVCIQDDHASKLEDRGWKIIKNQQPTLSLKLKPIIPTDDERAQKIVVHFQGTDIAPPQTITTFSKFSPIEKDNLPFLIPDNTFKDKTAMFYLESLPSSDKEWFYQLLERYVNAGKVPEEFDVTVEVFSGDETLLQIWEYNKCERENYELYLDDSIVYYKFHEKWQSELKDRTIFECAGLEFGT